MNTSDFLTRVRQAAQLPDDDSDWSADEILAEATQALYDRYTQPITTMRNGYWLHRVNTSCIAGVTLYRMPPRAVVQGLEKVVLSTDNGTTWKTLSILTDAETSDYINSTERGEPCWFSLESDCIALYPTPSSSYLLQMSYYLRPSVLKTAFAGGIVFAKPTSTTLTLSGDPTGYMEAGVGTADIVNTSGCNEVALVDVQYTSIVSAGFGLYTMTFPAGTDLTRIVLGQVIRPSDQTDQIPLPMELCSSLVAYTAAVILVEKGDSEKAAVLAQKAESGVKRVVDMATPRVKNAPPIMRTKNTYLRRRLGRTGAGFR